MTLEDWSTVFQFASVILLGLTFAIGAGAIWTSYLVGKRQQERIATAGQQAAEANEKAAKATEGPLRHLRMQLMPMSVPVKSSWKPRNSENVQRMPNVNCWNSRSR